jgi:hypothetical protein
MKYISSVHDQNTARGRARNALTARPIATDREHAPPTLVTARGVGHAGAYHPQLIRGDARCEQYKIGCSQHFF